MSESECHDVLKKALDADEAGNTDLAMEFYTKFVELTLKIENTASKEKLQNLARSALDRAEEIKRNSVGEKARTEDVSQQVSAVQPRLPSRGPTTSGAQGYTKEEKIVLEHTSHINKHIFVPFMSIDLSDKFIYTIPFTDPDGLLALAPKQKSELVSWERISELCEDAKMVQNQTVDFFSIQQTVVSDCSFVASLAVSALYEKKFGKALITSILFPKNSSGRPVYNPSGKYMVKLHVNGIPRKIVVDDYLPVGRHGKLLCSYSNNKSEFWVSILEKAYMKLMGGYDFPGSNSNIDLHALTGWIPERVAIKMDQSTFDGDAVFERLRTGLAMGRCLVTAATGDLPEVEEKRTGLVSTHAYAVLYARITADGEKLLQLKNPWSHLRWKGNYSELDASHWTPELMQELNYDPSVASKVDNGVFWIDYASVLHFFDVFYINWDPALFQHTYCVHQMWRAGMGPTKDVYTIAENPQFLLKINPGAASVWILLTRHITTIEDFRQNKEYIALVAYENDGRKVYYPYDPKPFHEGVRINSPHYLCKIRQDPQKTRLVTLAISQYEKSTTIYYTLRAYSRDRFELHKLDSGFTKAEKINGAWEGSTAGGCSNYPQTFGKNPKFRLTVGPRPKSTLLIELRAPKIYQVGFEVTTVSCDDPEVTASFIKQGSGVYRSGYCMLELENLPAGVYTVVPTTFLPGQEGPFILDIKCSTGVKIEEITSREAV
ncbi:calpain-7-like [Lutzomyia longipalpis]|uniref:calpain-7-like n=1 Tax=Lutzomyia longipalpis TaxID=7200 RepID=UPI002483773D|nr:calpain-7-like [Lutzomyia longipalpis]